MKSFFENIMKQPSVQVGLGTLGAMIAYNKGGALLKNGAGKVKDLFKKKEEEAKKEGKAA